MSDWRDVMEARRLSDAEAWATAQTKEDAVLVALNALRLEVRALATLLDHAIHDAAPQQWWQAIIDAKIGPCRVCCDPGRNGSQWGRIQMHHLVSRAQGGDDVPDNVVPLCLVCHGLVTLVDGKCRERLGASLTEAEREYVIGKLGEGALARLYGV